MSGKDSFVVFAWKRNVLAPAIIMAVWVFVCTQAASQVPDRAHIIEQYRQATAWHESFQMQVEIQSTGNSAWGGKVLDTKFVLRKDSDRQGKALGEAMLVDNNGNTTDLRGKNGRERIQEVFQAGDDTNTYYKEVAADPPRAYVNEAIKGDFLDILGTDFGGALFGRYNPFSSSTLADLLSQADSAVREENYAGTKCYVLETQAKEGSVTAWIAPDRGYNVLQYRLEKVADRDQTAWGEPFPDTEIKALGAVLPVKWTFEMTNVELQEVDGILVPAHAQSSWRQENSDGTVYENHSTLGVSEVDLSPTFPPDAFIFDVPNGTSVTRKLANGHTLRDLKWQDGKVVVSYDKSTVESIDQHVASLHNNQDTALHREQRAVDTSVILQPGNEPAIPSESGRIRPQILLVAAGVVVLVAAIGMRMYGTRAR